MNYNEISTKVQQLTSLDDKQTSDTVQESENPAQHAEPKEVSARQENIQTEPNDMHCEPIELSDNVDTGTNQSSGLIYLPSEKFKKEESSFKHKDLTLTFINHEAIHVSNGESYTYMTFKELYDWLS